LLRNICRSPLAEGILKSKLPTDKFIVDSAGTGSWHVGHSQIHAQSQLPKQKNIDISQQKGRQFKADDFNDFDYIYVMDKNYDDVLALAKMIKKESSNHS
jgi:protein-tyrosine phosphatase